MRSDADRDLSRWAPVTTPLSSAKVWVAGANGGLGRALVDVLATRRIATCASDHVVDIADAAQVDAFLANERPTHLVNCAAYTAVDQAEREQAAAQRANTEGPAVLAKACAARGLYAIQLSTDYVFDGDKGTPYLEDDAPAPRSVYGATKLAGERAFLDAISARGAVVRTSWLYSAHGKSFPRTMLRLMQERDELSVVSDQHGRPTWAPDLAEALLDVLARELVGTFHWANAGVTTWHALASAVREQALARGLPVKAKAMHPIPTSAYPTPAARPRWSVLDTAKLERALGRSPRPWQATLPDFFAALASPSLT